MCIVNMLKLPLTFYNLTPEPADSWSYGSWCLFGGHKKTDTTVYSKLPSSVGISYFPLCMNSFYTLSQTPQILSFALSYIFSTFWILLEGHNEIFFIRLSLITVHIVSFFFQLCPNGYYFAIDPNGYVLLHPDLQPKVWKIFYFISL